MSIRKNDPSCFCSKLVVIHQSLGEVHELRCFQAAYQSRGIPYELAHANTHAKRLRRPDTPELTPYYSLARARSP